MPSFCFLSTDLNGTLVHAHTMQEMIRVGFPEEPQRFETASRAFALQTDGKLSMSETFRIAGEQTRGLPLRVAINFALNRMSFVDGYPEFAAFLKEYQIPFTPRGQTRIRIGSYSSHRSQGTKIEFKECASMC